MFELFPPEVEPPWGFEVTRGKEIEQFGEFFRLHEFPALVFVGADPIGDLLQQIVGSPDLFAPQSLFDQFKRLPLAGAQTRLGNAPAFLAFRQAKSRFDLSFDYHAAAANATRNVFYLPVIFREIRASAVLIQLARLLDAYRLGRVNQPECARSEQERAGSEESAVPEFVLRFPMTTTKVEIANDGNRN